MFSFKKMIRYPKKLKQTFLNIAAGVYAKQIV